MLSLSKVVSSLLLVLVVALAGCAAEAEDLESAEPVETGTAASALGGVYVAAGDVDGATTAFRGGVTIAVSDVTNATAGFRGGVRVATGDVNGAR